MLKPASSYHFFALRVSLGLYLLWVFASVIPYRSELFSTRGVLESESLNFSFGYFPLWLQHFVWGENSLMPYALVLASLFLAAGLFRRTSSVILWIGLAAMTHSNNFILHPGVPFIGWLLISMLFIPSGEPISLARKKNDWRMPPIFLRAAWIIAAVSYSYSGFHKLANSPGWLEGTALSSILHSPLASANMLTSSLLSSPEQLLAILTWGVLGLEILFLPLCLFEITRRYAWTLMTLVHIGILSTLDIGQISLAMLIFHIFLFEPGWWSDGLKYEKKILRSVSDQFSKRLPIIAVAIATGMLWGAGFLFITPLLSALLGIAVSVLVAYLVIRSRINGFEIYLAAFCGHLVAFWWVKDTFSLYSGVGNIESFAFLCALSLFSSFQFLLFFLFYRSLNSGFLRKSALSLPVAWVSLEVLFYRPLPWAHGHTQIANLYLAQASDLGGVYLISFLLFWWGALLVRFFVDKDRGASFLLVFSICLVYGYGYLRVAQFDNLSKESDSIRVALFQENSPPAHHPSEEEIESRIDSYFNRTTSLYQQDPFELALWPENAVDRAAWLTDDRVYLDFSENYAAGQVPILFGGLTLSPLGRDSFGYFASAILIDTASDSTLVYHKTLPFPFGEVNPLATFIPYLKRSSSGRFTFLSNPSPEPLIYLLPDGRRVGIVAAICFETLSDSLISSLSSTRTSGFIAELSNHAWFGDSVVSLQHHMLASWRAIENRSYLVRVSNSGHSAVVDPVGRTRVLLPPGIRTEKVADVALMSQPTLYQKTGNKPVQFLAVITVLVVGSRLIGLFLKRFFRT